jgi:hypothetical protein
MDEKFCGRMDELWVHVMEGSLNVLCSLQNAAGLRRGASVANGSGRAPHIYCSGADILNPISSLCQEYNVWTTSRCDCRLLSTEIRTLIW